MKLNLIHYNDKTYLRATPVKKLFQSNLIHEVVTRGDVFALCLETGELTIIPGKAQVSFSQVSFPIQLPLL